MLGACLVARLCAGRDAAWLLPLVEAVAFDALRAACGSSCLLAERPCNSVFRLFRLCTGPGIIAVSRIGTSMADKQVQQLKRGKCTDLDKDL